MGTCYYGVCHDCKKTIDLGKFYWGSAAVYAGRDEEDHLSAKEVRQTYENWFPKDERLDGAFRPWIFLAFIGKHAGHRIDFLIEDNAYDLPDEYTPEWPD